MKKILTGSLLMLLLSSAGAGTGELRPYRLINADKLILEMKNDEYYSHLIGNVNFFYGDTEFFADRAELYEIQKIARLFGNVSVIEDTLTLYADRIEYKRLEEHINLYDNIKIIETHADSTVRSFFADQAQYMRNEEKIIAVDNVSFYDERDKISGYCHYLDYDLEKGYGFITQQPSIVFAGEDSLTISSEKIEFYRDFSRVAASFNVETVYTDYQVLSDFLLVFTEDDYAVFLGEPQYFSEFADASAEKIYLYFEDRTIKDALLENDCKILFRTDTNGEKNSELYSDTVSLLFNDGKVSGMKAKGSVRSTYRTQPGSKESFINYAESDSLVIGFDSDNEIENINFFGNVKGKYYFSDKSIERLAN